MKTQKSLAVKSAKSKNVAVVDYATKNEAQAYLRDNVDWVREYSEGCGRSWIYGIGFAGDDLFNISQKACAIKMQPISLRKSAQLLNKFSHEYDSECMNESASDKGIEKWLGMLADALPE